MPLRSGKPTLSHGFRDKWEEHRDNWDLLDQIGGPLSTGDRFTSDLSLIEIVDPVRGVDKNRQT